MGLRFPNPLFHSKKGPQVHYKYIMYIYKYIHIYIYVCVCSTSYSVFPGSINQHPKKKLRPFTCFHKKNATVPWLPLSSVVAATIDAGSVGEVRERRAVPAVWPTAATMTPVVGVWKPPREWCYPYHPWDDGIFTYHFPGLHFDSPRRIRSVTSPRWSCMGWKRHPAVKLTYWRWKYSYLVGSFQPIWKNISPKWESSPSRGENEKPSYRFFWQSSSGSRLNLGEFDGNFNCLSLPQQYEYTWFV